MTTFQCKKLKKCPKNFNIGQKMAKIRIFWPKISPILNSPRETTLHIHFRQLKIALKCNMTTFQCKKIEEKLNFKYGQKCQKIYTFWPKNIQF